MKYNRNQTNNTPVTPARPTRSRPQTDKNHQNRGEIGLQSVLIRFCRFGVGLCWGRQICRGEIFQTCLKDLSPTNCRLSVGFMSVWCRFCRGAFRDVSVLIRPPMVDGLSVMYRAYVGRPDTDSKLIQDRIKSDITANCLESADAFPNQNRRVPDISRAQTVCKPITVCGVIPTYKITPKIPENISSLKWRHKLELFEASLPQLNQLTLSYPYRSSSSPILSYIHL